MSSIKVNSIKNTSTADGGIVIDGSGHVTVDDLQMPTAGALSNRNLIINGAMQVTQRGTSLANTVDGAYLVDRFQLYDHSSNTHTITQSQSSDVPSGSTTSFTKALKLEVTSGAVTPTTGYTVIAQPIEGLNSAQLKYGTADAKTVTLSFWARTSVGGNYSICLRNSAADQNYLAQYALSVNTWTYVTVTVPGRTTGTWLTTNGKGLEVLLAIDVGSNFYGTNNTWNTASYKVGLVNDDNTWSDTTGNTFELTGVQLEVGSKTTPFEYRNYGDELARCQRYFSRSQGGQGGTYEIGVALPNLASRVAGPVKFMVTMRAAPTVTIYGANGGVGKVSLYNDSTADLGSNFIADNILEGGYRNVTNGSGLTSGLFYSWHWSANAEL